MTSVVKPVEKAYQMAAALFNSEVEELERESLRLYLTRRLKKLRAERFKIAKRHGVSTSEEMEELYKKKKLSERESWEDFFELDHIEAEIEKIESTLAVL